MDLVYGHNYLGINHGVDALSADAKPLGFLVTVLFDPANPEYSNKESLEAMEWTEVIVRESRR